MCRLDARGGRNHGRDLARGVEPTVARASRNYDTDAWVEYDSAFRRRAGNCGSLEWGTIDPALFTGRARNIKRCSYCVVDTHSLEECPYAPKGWADNSSSETRQRGPQRITGMARGGSGPRPDAVEICRLYNEKGGGCTVRTSVHAVSQATPSVRVYQCPVQAPPSTLPGTGRRRETSTPMRRLIKLRDMYSPS